MEEVWQRGMSWVREKEGDMYWDSNRGIFIDINEWIMVLKEIELVIGM